MTEQPVPAPAAKPAKLPLKDRLKALLDEYGKIAIATYFGIFALTICGFALAIQMGVKVEGAAGTAGIWAAAWVASKITQPLRILATLLLTPVIGKLIERFKKPKISA